MEGLELSQAAMTQEAANGRFAGSAQLAVSFGARWSRNSRLVRASLHHMLTSSSELEAMIGAEVAALVKSLFRPRYLSLCWHVITGHRLPEAETRRLTALFSAEMTALQNPWVDNRLLRTLFHERSGFGAVLRYRDAVREKFAEAVRGGGGRREGTFIARLRASKRDPLWRPETDEDLVMFFFDFLNAGCETTSAFCEWALTYLLRHPDRPHAHLARAFEAEVLRRSSLTPAGVPHRSLAEFLVGGYRVPSGAVLRYDIVGTQWNEQLWHEPDRFRPERFLRNGVFASSENLVPYGIGLRRCTGEEYAQAYHFLMMGGLLREFTVALPPGRLPPTEEATMGLTRNCLPFEAVFTSLPQSSA
ncbi:steroid 17-alpha-hydroxylase/17,20 lyase-like [Pollicipes pollicipes]|uniref:steroid 17-alpha-hydroxylase/17,20 lyase-like n=1 Tax=Pollicipes pollicipes TaxID=41117 RepID=UPI001885346D|nr:steroid 17-alpha-hydroxylase/17,20 lyase-like [Pollicipes pollicipes]